MSKKIKYSRFILKRSSINGVSATTAANTDHTSLPKWRTSDIYIGELFLNTRDEKMWVRTESSIKEIPLIAPGEFSLNIFSDVNVLSPTNGQVLTYSGGTWQNRNPEFAGTGITYSTISPLTSPMMSSIEPKMEITTQEIEKITDIKDVAISNLTDADMLIYQDGKWLNIKASNIPVKKPKLDELTNVNLSKPTDEQFLVFSNNKWINKTKLDKIENLTWDKSESNLLINTKEGIYKLSITGKPIYKVLDDITLDDRYHTLIVDASLQDINIYLPQALDFYGCIFKFRFINFTYNIKIIPNDDEFVFIDSLLNHYDIVDTDKFLTLQCDGESTWYSI